MPSEKSRDLVDTIRLSDFGRLALAVFIIRTAWSFWRTVNERQSS